jgi:kynurenine formamidase
VASYASKNVANWVDLTYPYTPDIPRWPTSKPLNITDEVREQSPDGYWIEYYSFCMAEHLGTHIDAPRHFNKNGLTINQVPLEHLMGLRE